MKYIILGYTNPNLNTGKADLNALCNEGDNLYWTNSKNVLNKENTMNYPKLFNSRSEADAFIKECDLECCISYGINENELPK